MNNKNQKQDRFSLYQGQAQTYAGFAGTMTAVVLFFTGIILTRFEEFDASIKVPIAFLLISVFGFLYGTLLYANAAQEVSDYHERGFRRAIFLGDIISEYLGVYLLVVSIPLVINVITEDIFLRTVTLAAAISGLAIYQFSHFSIIEHHFQGAHRLVSLCVILIGFLLFLAQAYALYFIPLSFIFLALIFCVAYTASRRFQ